MRTMNRSFSASLCTLILLLVMALIITTATCALAKGARRSDSSGDSGRGTGYGESRQNDAPPVVRSENRSESRPEPRPEIRTENRSENRPEIRSENRSENRPSDQQREPRVEQRSEVRSNDNPPPPQREDNNQTIHAPQRHKGNDSRTPNRDSTPPPSNNQQPSQYRPGPSSDTRSTPDMQTRDQRVDDRSTVQGPQRIKGSDQPSNSVLQSPANRGSETRQTTASRSVSSSLGVYRKEHADLADLWKERRERRDTRSDSLSRQSHSHTYHPNVHYNIFPCTYSYYAYDYDPWYCYPSVYCYYYGLFPPFIKSQRVVIIHRTPVVYRYVDVPLTVIYRDYPDYDDDYYLSGYRYRYLSSALHDIERAWERYEPELLLKHAKRGWKVDVFLKEDYSYTVDWEDFRQMTTDAMDHIRTVDFEFYKVRQREYAEMVAYAKHTYYDYDYYDERRNGTYTHQGTVTKKYNTVYVRYTLQRQGDEWYITEVGSAPYKL